MWKLLLLMILGLFTIIHISQATQPDTIYNQSHDWISGQHETLPEWIFIPQQQGMVIAVSDPCMKAESAKIQALQRAAYLYSLQQSTRLNLLSDLFTRIETEANFHDDEGNKIITMAVITQPFLHCSYQIEQEYTSLFGELFIQVSFTQKKDNYFSYRSASELMLSFTKERTEEEELKFILAIESKNSKPECLLQTNYQLRGKTKNLSVSSFINGIGIDFLQKGCWYKDVINPEKSETVIPIELKNSFWSAYIASFVKNLLLHPYSSMYIRQIEDNYDGKTNLSRELHREKASMNISVCPHIREIRENQLYVEWQIAEH